MHICTHTLALSTIFCRFLIFWPLKCNYRNEYNDVGHQYRNVKQHTPSPIRTVQTEPLNGSWQGFIVETILTIIKIHFVFLHISYTIMQDKGNDKCHKEQVLWEIQYWSLILTHKTYVQKDLDLSARWLWCSIHDQNRKSERHTKYFLCTWEINFWNINSGKANG